MESFKNFVKSIKIMIFIQTIINQIVLLKNKCTIQLVKTVNFILIFICLFGFVYQVYLILDQYMLGKTVVNVEVKRLNSQPMPSITICIPTFFSISKLSKLNEFNQSLYQEYMKLRSEGYNQGNFTQEWKRRMRELYLDIDLIVRRIKIFNFSQLFEISPMPNLNPNRNQAIIITFEGSTQSLINGSFIQNLNNMYYVMETPIHSVLFSPTSFCFTYFSALKDYWKTFQIDLEYISISIKNDFTQFYGLEYLIALHSNDMLQNYNMLNYFSVEPDQLYSVKFTQFNIELVLEGFESNCAEYDIGNEHGSNRMQSDCLVKCYGQFIKERYNSFPRGDLNILIRKNLFSYFGNISINLSDFKPHESDIDIICYERCKPDCNTKQFLTDIQTTRPGLSGEEILISLYHSSILDIIVRHSLEMTLLSFVCNFGGLLGMWLGFSVLSISQDIFHSIHRFCRIYVNKFNFISNNNINVIYLNVNNTIRRLCRIDSINFNFIQRFKPKINFKGLHIIKKSKETTNQNNLPMVEIQ